MNPMVTRCPKCGTAFRITSTQLESAKGAVRCGSCLNIFKAQDYLVKSSEPKLESANTPVATPIAPATPTPPLTSDAPTTPQTTPIRNIAAPAASAKPIEAFTTPSAPTPAKTVIDKQKALADEDDVLISDDMDQVEQPESRYDFDGFMDINLQPKQTTSLFEREIRHEPEVEMEQSDESWAESLLDDDEDTIQYLKKSPVPAEPIPTTTAPEYGADSEYNASAEYKTDSEADEHKYSLPLFSLVNEPTEQDQGLSAEFLQATNAGEPGKQTTDESSAFAAALFGQDQEEPQPEAEPQQSSKKPVKSTKIRAFDTSRAALLMNIIPAPVEFTSRRMRRWYQQKLWSSLTLIMGLLLILQVAYFKFDYFSRIEPFRTTYAFACAALNCKVQDLIDTNKISINNLIVRNHPGAANALIVDAILINNAPFEQPYPDLVLAFSTIDETPVASRRFTPHEYLAGELVGMQHIPQKQPVHITLELADPGPDAPNYHLSIP